MGAKDDDVEDADDDALVGYEDYDDVDSIASTMREQARRHRDYTAEGLLQMLERPAYYEVNAIERLVLDQEFLDRLGLHRAATQSGTAGREGDAKIIAEVLPVLRRRVADTTEGRQQRALYALVRLEGTEAPEALDGLGSGIAALEAAVLCALTDEPLGHADERPTSALPSSFVPALEKLVRSGKGKGRGAKSWTVFERPLVLAMLRTAGAGDCLRLAVEDDELRAHLLTHAVAAKAPGSLAPGVLTSLEARFEDAAARIESGRARGLPDRRELAVAACIAALVQRHPRIARRAASIFDMVPGVLALGAVGMNPSLQAFCTLLDGSIGDLDVPALRSLASHLLGDRPYVFATSACAWARLPSAEAATMTESFGRGRADLRAPRWDAAALAFAALPDPPATLGKLFADYAKPANLSPALRSALARTPVDVADVQALITKARNSDELRAALQLAADHRLTSLLRTALTKFRDGPFRIDAATEGLLPALVDDDNEVWLEAELDENPFRDRREALRRVAAARR